MDTREPMVLNIESLTEANQRAFRSEIEEVTKLIDSVSGTQILDWYANHGTKGMTGLSRVVNTLFLESLKEAGWEVPWRYFELSSQQATFEAGKQYKEQGSRLQVGLDFGSRHKQSSLAYLVRPTLLSRSSSGEVTIQSAGIIIAFTRATLEWGLWDKANSTFESLSSEIDLAAPVMTAATCLIGVDPARNLAVSKNLDYGGLDLELT
jgi:hypothetical protein